MKASSKVIRGALRVRAYDVFSRAVSEGVACGWRRAFKHTGEPNCNSDQVCEEIEREVMNAVCEFFDFCEDT